jgi:hypothetical protein
MENIGKGENGKPQNDLGDFDTALRECRTFVERALLFPDVRSAISSMPGNLAVNVNSSSVINVNAWRVDSYYSVEVGVGNGGEFRSVAYSDRRPLPPGADLAAIAYGEVSSCPGIFDIFVNGRLIRPRQQ